MPMAKLEPSEKRHPVRSGDKPPMRFRYALIGGFATAVILTAAIATAELAVLHFPHLQHQGTITTYQATQLIKNALAIVAGAGALIALVTTYRRQKTTEAADLREQEAEIRAKAAHAREETRIYNERFTTAASQLAESVPAIRIAGIYAMAGLADDWEAQRQTCVDVLCANLRMPYPPQPPNGAPQTTQQEFQATREARHTLIRVITAHLQPDETRPSTAQDWRALNFDFTGTTFDGGDFHNAHFNGTVTFARAHFTGDVRFDGAQFASGTTSFEYVQFTGSHVSFFKTQFTGGQVSFLGANFAGDVHFGKSQFAGGDVSFYGAKFAGSSSYFNGARFAGSNVDFRGAQFITGNVRFDGAEFSAGIVQFFISQFTSGNVYFLQVKFTGSTVSFASAEFTGSTVHFGGADFAGGDVSFRLAQFAGGNIHFDRAQFTGGNVDFGRARFLGSCITFGNAQFTGGNVDLSDPGDWTTPPQFDVTGQPPSGLLLPPETPAS
jgi:uncharacterized protein YjbI with pentapeptide repeats